MKYFNRESVKHIVISCILTILFAYFFDSVNLAILVTLSLGIVKEIYDHFKKNKNTFLESLSDILSDALGIAFEYFISIILIP